MKHYIIPIFIPHYGCTHSCIFCNQQKITGRDTPVRFQEVVTIINEHLTRITEKRYIEVAFYGGSFTALPLERQSQLLESAHKALMNGRIHSIRLSTRPDCITQEIVENLVNYGVSTVELGVQSLDNKVLQASARGHSSLDVFQAVSIIKKMNLRCGLQLMPGLPLEDWRSLIHTAYNVIKLVPDFVRIYPTLVIADTQLANLYQKGHYKALSLTAGIVRGAFLKLIFEHHGIPTIRTGLQATEELDKGNVVLAGPYHPAFGEMVDSYVFYIMLAHWAESILFSHQTDDIIIHHHPRDTSKIRGIYNENIKKFKKNYGITNLILIPDGVIIDEVVFEFKNLSYVINKKMLFYI
jgi:histone acetyltransferase (RNA polymerase elongator complex component)